MHNFLFYHLINKDTVLFLSVEPLDIPVKHRAFAPFKNMALTSN